MAPKSEQVKRPRKYDSPRRAEQAARTRRAILAAARDQFATRGYTATAIADIAKQADVAVDTIYATIGRKPALLREVVESAISGTDHRLPAEERDYVRRTMAAPTAPQKLAVYAEGLVAVQARLATTFQALRNAAATDADCAALWDEISQRRAGNMLRFAADLRSTGEIRADLTDQEVADVIWTMNAAEYFDLLRQRGWSTERIRTWLSDAWTRLLLA